MGTWGSGPFASDAALDLVGSTMDHLMRPVRTFLDDPAYDETFEPAFAAITLMNLIMERTPSRPWLDGCAVDGAPIRAAMLACFEREAGPIGAPDSHLAKQRAALIIELDRFATLTAG